MAGDLLLMSGSAHPALAESIAGELKMGLVDASVGHRVTVAPLLAEAIKRIHDGESVSDLFR